MPADLGLGRNTYRRSGGVNWLRFPFFAGCTFLVGLVMAFCLYLAFDYGFYYFIMAPLVAALPVAGIAYLAVGGGHCRNTAVAGLFGLVAAAVLYLGYFYVHLVSILGPAGIARVDALPSFIAFRMNNDVAVDERGNENLQGSTMNWVFFGVEFFLVIAILVGPAVTRASQAYCENCQCWMRRRSAKLPLGAARAVQQSLESGSTDHFVEMPALEGTPEPPYAIVLVESCPQSGDQACSGPIYLTAKEVTKGSTMLLNQVEVTRQEIEMLSGKVAVFSGL